MIAAYLENGADQERALRRNHECFDRYALRQRVLTGGGQLQTARVVAGTELALPVVLAPTGLTGLFHPTAELGAARAAEQMGTRLVLSTASSSSIEDVAAGTATDHWFQLYSFGDRSLTRSLLDRAEANGMSALFVTVDTPVVGNRVSERRTGMGVPPSMTAATLAGTLRHPRWIATVGLRRRFVASNLTMGSGGDAAVRALRTQVRGLDPSASWNDLRWIREKWAGPLVVKGLTDPADARRAVDSGADGVVVSNHGGRQLGYGVGTLDALVDVVDAVGEETEVLVDGGVRSGADVIIAAALGARACLVGRAFLYGLASSGPHGVSSVLQIIDDELRRAMRLMGVADIDDLTSSSLIDLSANRRPHRASQGDEQRRTS